MLVQSNYIVFQCYGHEAVFHECTFALLSLSLLYDNNALPNTEIWIYTDNPAWFHAFVDCRLIIKFRDIDNSLIKSWRGRIDFVHRVKIEMLRDMTSNRQGNILYTDTDVIFTRPLDRILENVAAGRLYMHVMEGRVSDAANPILEKLNDYLQGNQRQLNGKPLSDMNMWNAGVLGFNSNYAPILDEVLTFTDKEYPKFSKHVVEQFAFSAFFQEESDIKTAAPWILHYWNLKEARPLLRSFFDVFENESWPDLVRYSQLIQLPVLLQEKANFYQNRSISDKLQKKQWEPAIPHWASLVKQL